MFPKKIIVLIYQAAMRGKRMRLFAYRGFLANLLKHLLEFTHPYPVNGFINVTNGFIGRRKRQATVAPPALFYP